MSEIAVKENVAYGPVPANGTVVEEDGIYCSVSVGDGQQSEDYVLYDEPRAATNGYIVI